MNGSSARRATISWLALLVIAAMLGAIVVMIVRSNSVSAITAPRLYVLDCGTIGPLDPALFDLSAGELAADAAWLASPCYLVVHPKGTLLWDVGQVPDADIPDDGSEVVQQGVFRARRSLRSQLAALGYEPEDIDYVAMSHHHADHSANANAFANSTWIVQQAEVDVMFGDRPQTARPELYRELLRAKRVTLRGTDHDVFGDDTVIVKSAPGHTPGHQVLFLKLRSFGGLLLMGDLYHLSEQKVLDRVSTFDSDAITTRATRQRLEDFSASNGAMSWIQHDPLTYASARKPPAYYE